MFSRLFSVMFSAGSSKGIKKNQPFAASAKG